jgi:hypothetical protein
MCGLINAFSNGFKLPTLIYLYVCLKRTKYKSGENSVWPTGRKEIFKGDVSVLVCECEMMQLQRAIE